MIHETKWKPDTCDCTITYLTDDATPNVQTVGSVENACSVHAHLTKGADLFTSLLTENQGKNAALKQVKDAIPTALVEVVSKDGIVSKELKPGVEVNWEFDATRKLIITTKGLSFEEKASVELVNSEIALDSIII